MKVRKIPIRTCSVTGEKCEKKDLLRIVRMPDGKVDVDLTGKINGRGAYIKKEKSVLEKAKKSKVLEKRLGVKISEDVYEKIENII